MRTFLYLVALLTFAPLSYSQQPLPDVDAAPWDALLKEFVNAQHRVDYARLKREGSGRLKDYTSTLAEAGNQPPSADQEKALLINAYNAFTVQLGS